MNDICMYPFVQSVLGVEQEIRSFAIIMRPSQQALDALEPRDQALLQRLMALLRYTFTAVRTANCEQTIRLTQKGPNDVAIGDAVSDATPTGDGAAGSALLNEVRMRLGLDVVPQRERLKQLLVLGLRILRMPVRSAGRGPRAPLCASLRVCGQEPPEGRMLALTLRSLACLPLELLIRIEEAAGGFWWGRRRWDGSLPVPTSRLRAFSADVPSSLVKVFHRVACFPRTEFNFSDGSKVYVEWGPSNQLWMRGTSLIPFVALVRCQRGSQRRPGAATVLSVRGAGDVLV